MRLVISLVLIEHLSLERDFVLKFIFGPGLLFTEDQFDGRHQQRWQGDQASGIFDFFEAFGNKAL